MRHLISNTIISTRCQKSWQVKVARARS